MTLEFSTRLCGFFKLRNYSSTISYFIRKICDNFKGRRVVNVPLKLRDLWFFQSNDFHLLHWATRSEVLLESDFYAFFVCLFLPASGVSWGRQFLSIRTLKYTFFFFFFFPVGMMNSEYSDSFLLQTFVLLCKEVQRGFHINLIQLTRLITPYNQWK